MDGVGSGWDDDMHSKRNRELLYTHSCLEVYHSSDATGVYCLDSISQRGVAEGCRWVMVVGGGI
jgi:hypothetical protein